MFTWFRFAKNEIGVTAPSVGQSSIKDGNLVQSVECLTQRERPKSRSLISCKLLGWLILIWEMEATCWRSLETNQQWVPLLQEQPPRLQHLLKDLSSCISSQSDHFWSSAFSWIWDHILCCKSSTYRNQSNYKDPFRSLTREQSVHKIDVLMWSSHQR